MSDVDEDREAKVGELLALKATLPRCGDDLEGLGKGWHLWPYGEQTALVRRLDAERYVAVVPMLFTFAVMVGRFARPGIYDDRWCYGSRAVAVVEASVWEGDGEPDGWHRHPRTGQRRPDGDPDREYLNP